MRFSTRLGTQRNSVRSKACGSCSQAPKPRTKYSFSMRRSSGHYCWVVAVSSLDLSWCCSLTEAPLQLTSIRVYAQHFSPRHASLWLSPLTAYTVRESSASNSWAYSWSWSQSAWSCSTSLRALTCIHICKTTGFITTWRTWGCWGNLDWLCLSYTRFWQLCSSQWRRCW